MTTTTTADVNTQGHRHHHHHHHHHHQSDKDTGIVAAFDRDLYSVVEDFGCSSEQMVDLDQILGTTENRQRSRRAERRQAYHARNKNNCRSTTSTQEQRLAHNHSSSSPREPRSPDESYVTDSDNIPTRDAGPGLDLSFSNNASKTKSARGENSSDADDDDGARRRRRKARSVSSRSQSQPSRSDPLDRRPTDDDANRQVFSSSSASPSTSSPASTKKKKHRGERKKGAKTKEGEKSTNNNSLNFQKTLERFEKGTWDEREEQQLSPEERGCGHEGSHFRRPSTWDLVDPPNRLTITPNNVDTLLISARFYNQSDVISLCKDALLNCSAEDALYYKHICEKHELNDIRLFVEDYVRANFTSIVNTHSFLGMSIEQVCCFLSDDGIKVTTELDVFNAARAWIEHSKHDRIQQAPEILNCVRFLHIGPEDIVRNVEPHAAFFKGVSGHDTLLDVYRYHALSGGSIDTLTGLGFPPPRMYIPLSVESPITGARASSEQDVQPVVLDSSSPVTSGDQFPSVFGVPYSQLNTVDYGSPERPAPPTDEAGQSINPSSVFRQFSTVSNVRPSTHDYDAMPDLYMGGSAEDSGTMGPAKEETGQQPWEHSTGETGQPADWPQDNSIEQRRVSQMPRGPSRKSIVTSNMEGGLPLKGIVATHANRNLPRKSIMWSLMERDPTRMSIVPSNVASHLDSGPSRKSVVTSNMGGGSPRKSIVTSDTGRGSPRKSVVTSNMGGGSPRKSIVTSNMEGGSPRKSIVTSNMVSDASRKSIAAMSQMWIDPSRPNVVASRMNRESMQSVIDLSPSEVTAEAVSQHNAMLPRQSVVAPLTEREPSLPNVAPSQMWREPRPSVAPSQMWTDARPSVAPSQMWTDARPSVAPSQMWTDARPSVAPSQMWTDRRPSMAPSQMARDPRPSIAPSEMWKDPRPSVAPSQMWTDHRPSVAPSQMWTDPRPSVAPSQMARDPRPSVAPSQMARDPRPSVAPSQMWTGARPSVAPSQMWTDHRPSDASSQMARDPRPSIAPSQMWTDPRPSIAPSQMARDPRPSVAPSQMWTGARPSVAPSQMWTDARPSVAPSQMWTDRRPSIAPSQMARDPRPSIAPSQMARDPRPSIAPSQMWKDPRPSVAPSQMWTDPRPSVAPSQMWTDPRPSIASSQMARDPRPSIAPSQMWKDPRPSVAPSQMWKDPRPSIAPSQMWKDPSPNVAPSRMNRQSMQSVGNVSVNRDSQYDAMPSEKEIDSSRYSLYPEAMRGPSQQSCMPSQMEGHPSIQDVVMFNDDVMMSEMERVPLEADPSRRSVSPQMNRQSSQQSAISLQRNGEPFQENLMPPQRMGYQSTEKDGAQPNSMDLHRPSRSLVQERREALEQALASLNGGTGPRQPRSGGGEGERNDFSSQGYGAVGDYDYAGPVCNCADGECCQKCQCSQLSPRARPHTTEKVQPQIGRRASSAKKSGSCLSEEQLSELEMRLQQRRRDIDRKSTSCQKMGAFSPLQEVDEEGEFEIFGEGDDGEDEIRAFPCDSDAEMTMHAKTSVRMCYTPSPSPDSQHLSPQQHRDCHCNDSEQQSECEDYPVYENMAMENTSGNYPSPHRRGKSYNVSFKPDNENTYHTYNESYLFGRRISAGMGHRQPAHHQQQSPRNQDHLDEKNNCSTYSEDRPSQQLQSPRWPRRRESVDHGQQQHQRRRESAAHDHQQIQSPRRRESVSREPQQEQHQSPSPQRRKSVSRESQQRQQQQQTHPPPRRRESPGSRERVLHQQSLSPHSERKRSLTKGYGSSAGIVQHQAPLSRDHQSPHQTYQRQQSHSKGHNSVHVAQPRESRSHERQQPQSQQQSQSPASMHHQHQQLQLQQQQSRERRLSEQGAHSMKGEAGKVLGGPRRSLSRGNHDRKSAWSSAESAFNKKALGLPRLPRRRSSSSGGYNRSNNLSWNQSSSVPPFTLEEYEEPEYPAVAGYLSQERVDRRRSSTNGLKIAHHPYTNHVFITETEPGQPLIVTAGGLNPREMDPEVPCRLVQLFDPNENEWSLLAKLPEPRHHHGCVMLDGFLYVIGGSVVNHEDLYNMSNTTNTCYRYDFTGDYWTEIAPMRCARMYHAVAVLEGVIYAVGGETTASLQDAEHPFLDSCEYYNADTDQWGPIANLLDGTIGAAVVGYSGLLWVIGGFLEQGDDNVVLGVVECYDPRTNSWISRAPLPSPRCHASVCEVLGQLFLVGGSVVSQGMQSVVSLNQVLLYHEDLDLWEEFDTMVVPRHDASCCAIDSLLYVIGGVSSVTGEVLSNVDCLDVETGEWLLGMEPMPNPALGLVCASIQPEYVDDEENADPSPINY